MKIKTKFGALALTVLLGLGALVGCNNPAPSEPEPPIEYIVNVPTSSDYTIAGLEEDRLYEEGATVSFSVELTNTDKEITEVGYDQTKLTEKTGGGYEFTMPAKNVQLYVSTKDIERYSLSHSGTLQVDGDPVTFTLSLGTDPVTDEFTLEAVEGADKVSINGVEVTGIAEGNAVIAAKIDGTEVAREAVTVERSAYYTIADAIADAWTDANFSDNSKNTTTETKYKIRAKIVWLGKDYNNYTEAIIDDGTGTLVYRIKTNGATITEFAEGDVIMLNESLQNYYGALQVFTSAPKYATVLEDYSVNTHAVTNITSSTQYDEFLATNLMNTGDHKVLPVTLTAKATLITESENSTKERYVVEGATNGVLATSKSIIDLEWVEDATYSFQGYLHSWNSKYSYANLIVTQQNKVAATEVTLSETEVELNVNNTKQLTYTTVPTGAGLSVAWTSSVPAVATVEDGLVTALTPGSTTITLTVDGLTATCEVTVNAEPVPVTSASFYETELTINDLETVDLNELLTYAPLDTTDVAEWTSSVETVATVADGVVTPVDGANGATVITVKFNDSVSATITINVEAINYGTAENPLTADEFVALINDLELENNEPTAKQVYVKAVVSTNDAWSTKYSNYGDRIYFHSSTKTKAFYAYRAKPASGVDNSEYTAANSLVGKTLTLCGSGTIYNGTIQFAQGALITSIENIDYPTTNIELDRTSLSIESGQTAKLTATLTPAWANSGVTWTSSTPAVATVEDGLVTALTVGTTTITATSNGLSVTCEVTVTASVSHLATFEFGENGEASHADGSAITAPKTYTDGDYVLTFASASKVYDGARDAQGNSCLKLGTGSAAGSFTLTIPEGVNTVTILVAQYKANAATVTVNGVATVLTTASTNGEYQEIEVNTSTNKTVTFAVTSGNRCMINTVYFD